MILNFKHEVSLNCSAMSSYFTVRFHKNKNHTWLTFASHPDEFLILHLIFSVFVYLLSFSGPQVNAQITWRFFFDIFSTYLSLWPAQQSFMSGSYFWLFSQTVQFPVSLWPKFLFHEKVRIQRSSVRKILSESEIVL